MASGSGGVGLAPVNPNVPRVVSITREPSSVTPGLRIANPPLASPRPVAPHPVARPVARPVAPHPAAPGTRITNDPNAVTPEPSYPSPYDASYYGALKTATFNANNRINQSNLQSGYAATDLQGRLGALDYNQHLATVRDQNAENARGGFALGHLGETLGNLNHQYLDTRAQDEHAYQRGEDARSAARAALQGGLSLTQAALAAAAVERASTQAAKNPVLSQSNDPLIPPAPTQAAPVPKPVTKGSKAKPVFRPGLRIANPPDAEKKDDKPARGRGPVRGAVRGAARGSGGVAI